MIEGLAVLGTVCARGGSKGVPGKNIRLLGGRPLICHTLDCARASALLDHCVVSSDDEAILKVAREHGYAAACKRPPELATDSISRIEAIRHALLWAETAQGRTYDIVVDLGVATPLKSTADLDACLHMLVAQKSGNLLTAAPAAKNPYFNMVEVVDGRVKLVCAERRGVSCRQEAPAVYDMNDAFNVWRRSVLFSATPQFNESTRLYVMPAGRSVDIDTEMDFKLAHLYWQEQL